MRLIDADKLRARYQAILDRGDMFCEYDIIGMVDNAPTVERSHGEWGKWIITVIQCPDCLECFNFPMRVYSMEVLKECPNCGADMRGKEE